LDRDFGWIGFRFSEAGWSFGGLDSDGGFQDKNVALTIQRLPFFNTFLHLFDYWRECFDFWQHFFDFWIFNITQLPLSIRI
jgi:hypothetical protein